MCITPGILQDGTKIACRKCWQCLENRVEDWVGRCLAESKTVKHSYSITLTYGRDENGNEDHIRAAWLTYSDVQKFFKYMRADGIKFKYLVAGEYGSQKGRAHWHAILFFDEKLPDDIVISNGTAKRFMNKYWPHGYQHWERPSAASIRYVCKYITKDMGKEERQGHLSMSKKPPLGDLYFQLLAQQYVDAGLAPQDYTYGFPDVLDKKGKPKRFYMSGTTAKNFVEYFKERWRLSGQSRHHPYSEMINLHDDKMVGEIPMLRQVGNRKKVELPFVSAKPDIGINPLTGYPGWFTKYKYGILWLVKLKETGSYSWVDQDAMMTNGISLMACPSGKRLKKSDATADGSSPPETPLSRWVRWQLGDISLSDLIRTAR